MTRSWFTIAFKAIPKGLSTVRNMAWTSSSSRTTMKRLVDMGSMGMYFRQDLTLKIPAAPIFCCLWYRPSTRRPRLTTQFVICHFMITSTSATFPGTRRKSRHFACRQVDDYTEFPALANDAPCRLLVNIVPFPLQWMTLSWVEVWTRRWGCGICDQIVVRGSWIYRPDR